MSSEEQDRAECLARWLAGENQSAGEAVVVAEVKRLLAENGRLRAEKADIAHQEGEWMAQTTAALNDADRLRAECERLREALKPFADWWAQLGPDNLAPIAVDAYRRAAELLKGDKG